MHPGDKTQREAWERVLTDGVSLGWQSCPWASVPPESLCSAWVPSQMGGKCYQTGRCREAVGNNPLTPEWRCGPLVWALVQSLVAFVLTSSLPHTPAPACCAHLTRTWTRLLFCLPYKRRALHRQGGLSPLSLGFTQARCRKVESGWREGGKGGPGEQKSSEGMVKRSSKAKCWGTSGEKKGGAHVVLVRPRGRQMTLGLNRCEPPPFFPQAQPDSVHQPYKSSGSCEPISWPELGFQMCPVSPALYIHKNWLCEL